MGEIEYREETPDGWTDEVASGWSIEQSGDDVRAVGQCPTCKHTTSSSFTRLTATKALSSTFDVIIYCRCTVAHPGAPEGKGGCGRQGRFELELD